MALTEEILNDCLESCRALNKAYKQIVRKNVEVMLRDKHGVDDSTTVDATTEETLRRLKNI